MKKYTLPRDFAEKWIAALRSGKYNQTRGSLRDQFGYCCLGVACVINGISDDDIDLEGFIIDAHIGDDNTEKMPEQLIGMDENELVSELTAMNDRDSEDAYSFPEIADWIEENVEFVP